MTCSGRSWWSYCSRPAWIRPAWRRRPGFSSGIAVISVGEGGQNRIVQALGANDTCGDTELDAVERLLPSASVLMLQLEVSVELSMRVAELAREPASTCYWTPGRYDPFHPNSLAMCR